MTYPIQIKIEAYDKDDDRYDTLVDATLPVVSRDAYGKMYALFEDLARELDEMVREEELRQANNTPYDWVEMHISSVCRKS